MKKSSLIILLIIAIASGLFGYYFGALEVNDSRLQVAIEIKELEYDITQLKEEIFSYKRLQTEARDFVVAANQLIENFSSKKYKKYTNNEYGFSMDIPINWKEERVQYEDEEGVSYELWDAGDEGQLSLRYTLEVITLDHHGYTLEKIVSEKEKYGLEEGKEHLFLKCTEADCPLKSIYLSGASYVIFILENRLFKFGGLYTPELITIIQSTKLL